MIKEKIQAIELNLHIGAYFDDVVSIRLAKRLYNQMSPEEKTYISGFTKRELEQPDSYNHTNNYSCA